MRDYGKVLPSFWIGETGKKLRGDAPAQVLAMYLMTCPHSTWTGVYHCPILYMAHETGLGMEGASKALARLLEVGFCTYDEASEVVFVVKMAAYQIASTIKPEDKRHKGILKDVENMSPPVVRAQFIATYSVAFNLPKRTKKASPFEAPSKPLPSQEQEQEQEQEQPPSPIPSNPSGFDLFWSAYPKKVGKPAAVKAFKSAKINGHIGEVLADIEAKKSTDTWGKNGGQFIPNPATYLNQRRWEDGTPEVESPSIFAGAI